MGRWKRIGLQVGGMVSLGLGAILILWLSFRQPSAAASTHVLPQSSGDPPTGLVISAVHVGLSGFGGKDEAFRITNISTASLVLTDTWGVMDQNNRAAYFPATGVTLMPGTGLWCARNALSFTLAFGFMPLLEYGDDSTPAVPDMVQGGSLAFADDGGALVLFRRVLVDTANGDGGAWPAGDNDTKSSMERVDPTAFDSGSNWATAVMTGGIDAGGYAITGTPGHTNSVYASSGAGIPPIVAINEIAWMGTRADYTDEWIELYNNCDRDVDLNGWLLVADDGTPSILLSGTLSARGFYLLERSNDATVGNRMADQIYTGSLENSNESLRLYQAYIVDVMLYGNAARSHLGWSGAALQPYSSGGATAGGQLFFRKRSESVGLPLPDTNTAADWANDAAPGNALYGPVHEGDLLGKRTMYPGWDWDTYTDTFEVAATASLTVGIAPDNMYTVVAELLQGATKSILIEGYTFESLWLTGILTERIGAGVQVTVLLEGAPAGGLPEAELWNCQRIVQAGGHVYFMHNDDTGNVYDRYSDLHAKYIVVDGKRVAVGSENWGNHAMPVDDKSNGTAGNRGVVAIADQPEVAAYLKTLFARDCDLAHPDIVGYGTLPRYTAPWTYTAVYSPGGGFGYPALFSATLPAFQADQFEVIHAPETGLRHSDGLIGLVLRARPGDVVTVEQMYERVHWGSSSSSPVVDPNPRLEAYIQAARQGATVRILLDKGFDDDRQNDETAFYILNVARSEGLDLQVRLGNPTARGVHNKMVLVSLDGQKYVHVGSLNGSESSSKVNREVALQARSSGAYDYMMQVFDYDWLHSGGPYEMLLPLVFRDDVPESDHVLISEVVFNLPGAADLGEWVELYNPTDSTVDIGGWYLGDAVHSTDYERLYAFPAGTAVPPGGTLVIARQATAYQGLGYASQPVPDLEWNNSSDSVPDMAVTGWGRHEFALGNAGDEVILLDSAMQAVDVLTYGTGSYPGVLSFGDVSGVYSGSSLERWPANRDSDNCQRDFRVRYTPDPGKGVVW